MITLKTDLLANFTGKARDKTTTIPAGTEIGDSSKSRWNDKGVHMFIAKEYGRWSTYSVSNAAVLDAALGDDSAAVKAKSEAIKQIVELMARHAILISEIQ